jgi:hypothetical protein
MELVYVTKGVCDDEDTSCASTNPDEVAAMGAAIQVRASLLVSIKRV